MAPISVQPDHPREPRRTWLLGPRQDRSDGANFQTRVDQLGRQGNGYVLPQGVVAGRRDQPHFSQASGGKADGGPGGGGARLTKLGRDIVGRYRAIEGAAAMASAADLRALKASLPAKPLT